ncbi:DUF397 domain-containing protein [Gandjariella thermophila]|uniref:DUF397 domain-containing protein n=1 Tax=Gandjariella thermophila TaxID=1931992 RepID=A0A4D4JBE8_9PSEU|nr:hypothetical protein GTS_36210 [Gandjariella thermophila]
MRQQLKHLLRLADRDNITLHVMPLSVPVHDGLDGEFTLLEFAEPQSIGYVEFRTAPCTSKIQTRWMRTLRLRSVCAQWRCHQPTPRRRFNCADLIWRTAMPTHGEPVAWRKSTRSSNGANCVEVAVATDGATARDSKNPCGPTLTFAPATTFLREIKSSRLDHR